MTPPVEDVPQLDGVVAPLAVVPGRLLLLAVGLLLPAPGPAVQLCSPTSGQAQICEVFTPLLAALLQCVGAQL